MKEQTITPSYDNKIYCKYSKSTIKNKVQNKLFLQKELWLEEEKKKAMICITCELTDKNGAKIIEEAIKGILELDVQVLVLWIGSIKYQKLFAEIEEQNKDKIQILENSELNKRKIYAASNISLIFNKSSNNMLELKNLLAYGVVPVALEDPILTDYNPITESGNAFIFSKENKWLFFAAIVRAIENFKFTYDWQNIELAVMATFD